MEIHKILHNFSGGPPILQILNRPPRLMHGEVQSMDADADTDARQIPLT